MSEFKHACALLSMAEKDLRALEGMRDAATFADEIFGFHAQQAVEKIMKAGAAHIKEAHSDMKISEAQMRSMVRSNMKKM